MGLLAAAADGTLRHVWTNEFAQEHAALGVTPDVDATSTLAIDSDTNAALFADVSATILAYRLSADGVLTKDGEPVTINPPAPPPPSLNEQLAGALAALPADQPITGGQLAEVIALLRGPQ